MNYAALIKAIQSATSQLQGRVATMANQALVLRNWLVGAYLVEFEQNGKDRAAYGERLLESVAADLRANGTRGFNATLLRLCRQAYCTYPQIHPTVSDELADLRALPIFRAAASRKLARKTPATASTESQTSRIRLTPSAELPPPLSPELLLRLSWSQIIELIAIEDSWKRAFFENECLQANWSVRQLRRQIGSLLYERTGLSTNKQAVIERARRQEPRQAFADLIRDPYVLEFTGLAERPEYSEDDLESALLDHLQRFLLELGRGFCFEARQFRMTEGRRHHRVDLVFYHRLLRCHVLIDLKVRAFEPADAGQMNFYVNWFKTHIMTEGDNPPVGILLCSDKDRAEVEFATAGMDQKLFVSRYLVALPSAEKLRAFLEADRDRIESQIARIAPASKPAPKSKKPNRKR
jgi:predicted nuclease of restriction endonuclease-like (RecB) superfamily